MRRRKIRNCDLIRLIECLLNMNRCCPKVDRYERLRR